MPRQHSIIREGLLTGLLGGVAVALWYLVVDLGRGQLLYTPNVLGQVFVGRDTMPTRAVVPQAVGEYWLLHFGLFILLGIALVVITHLASRNPALRMGVWLGLVISFLLFLGFLVTLYSATNERFPWLTAVGATFLGMGVMGLYLWRRHPGLRGTFDQAPLGDEVRAPPHPRGTGH